MGQRRLALEISVRYLLGALTCSVVMAALACSPAAAPPMAAPTGAPFPTTAPVAAPTRAGLPTLPPSPPTPVPTPTATPVRMLVVGNTEGLGVYLRRTPEMGDRLQAYPDGTQLVPLGEEVERDGQVWLRVAAPDGTEGFVPAMYVIAEEAPPAELVAGPTPELPLVLVSVSELPPAGLANPDVGVTREYVYYDLSGSTLAELNDQIHQRGPPDEHGRRWAGRVNVYFNWRFHYTRFAGQCQVDSAAVDLAVTYILPRWQAPPGVAPALLGEWRRFLAALQTHEEGHEAIALGVAEQIHLSLLALPPHSCDQIDQAANDLASSLVATEAHRQAQYDHETEHGRTQGAVLGGS